jgi:electron transport complex protein RnfC
VIIEPDGLDQWTPHSGNSDYTRLEPTLLLQLIRTAGVAGLGGAGFPTSVKLNPSKETTISTLVINAAECEPYITADDMLMREFAGDIIRGILIIAFILKTGNILIGIEGNKPEAIQALKKAISAHDNEQQIELVVIPTKYPSGGEKQLIQILTGCEVPNGGIPADIGVVCQNVGTAVAVYRAIVLGEPLISRVTTFTGGALKQPRNLAVLIGTPVNELLEFSGLNSSDLTRLVMGGPMMGFSLLSDTVPIIKTTNCILAASTADFPAVEPEQACIRCGMCETVCPASLLPQQLYWHAKSKDYDKAISHNLLDCIECGACAYVCPSNIPLVQYYRHAKGEIRTLELEHTKSEHSRQRFEKRLDRFAREAAEREAKKKARRQAAAKSATDKNKGPNTDDRSAVIQAALERTKAKKAQKRGTSEQASEIESAIKTAGSFAPIKDKENC